MKFISHKNEYIWIHSKYIVCMQSINAQFRIYCCWIWQSFQGMWKWMFKEIYKKIYIFAQCLLFSLNSSTIYNFISLLNIQALAFRSVRIKVQLPRYRSMLIIIKKCSKLARISALVIYRSTTEEFYIDFVLVLKVWCSCWPLFNYIIAKLYNTLV